MAAQLNPKNPEFTVFENETDFLSPRVIPADFKVSAVTNFTKALSVTVTSDIGKVGLETLIGTEDPPREHLTLDGTEIAVVTLATITLRAGKPV